MGLAATQTRFLQCTARKSDIEYKALNINQARTDLANKSGALYQELLSIKVPTPPSVSAYTNQAGEIDYDAYENAYNQYDYERYLYEQEQTVFNAKSVLINEQDKRLALAQTTNETEQSALKTELEALSTVLDDNIEASFKAFA